MRRIAVMAHYDANGLLDPYLMPFVRQLSQLCEKVFIVSTSGVTNDWVSQFSNVYKNQKENIGYDFCSYKFGLDQVDGLHSYHQLIICNDSFYTLDHFSLDKLLTAASKEADIVGLTDNYQFSYHLQSYFLVFNQRALHSKWFASFWSKVQPLKNKMQIIWRYEIGLSQTALMAGLTLNALYKPLNTKVGHIKSRILNKFLGAANPTHMNAPKVAKELGVAKVDLFRLNISSKPIEQFIGKDSSVFSLINEHSNRTSSYYKKQHILKNVNSVSSSIFNYVATSGSKSRVAVVLHLYHVDLAREIMAHLERIPENFDLFISICDYAELNNVAASFSGKANNLFISVFENRGRDVLPFLTILKNIDYEQYSCVLKIHSKKSTYSSQGEIWRQKIFNNLLPNSSKVQDVIARFDANKAVGIIAPFEAYLSNEMYWGANKEKLLKVMQNIMPTDEVELFFVGGTMFWFAPTALKAVVDSVSLDDFEPEAGQQDGTMAHTIERSFCLSALISGSYCYIIENLEENVSGRDVQDNRVGVLQETLNAKGQKVIRNVQ